MRGEQEMLDLIIETARRDERIRAVVMNGSRTNPHARRDIFQDFDIIYLVTDVAAFRAEHRWINRFGELLILQMPEAMADPPPINDGRFTYLMQFTDGNRLDLTLFPIDRLGEFKAESLSLLLLDKDGLVGPLPPPSARDYLPTPPTATAFYDCCNEFLWVCLNVAKGLWREEIIYAKYMLDQLVRAQLIKMLTWHVGVQTQFLRGAGQHGEQLKQYLEPELWALLEQTYTDADYEHTWTAVYAMCDLFRAVANQVAAHFGFAYPRRDDEQVSAHLKRVQALARQAQRRSTDEPRLRLT